MGVVLPDDVLLTQHHSNVGLPLESWQLGFLRLQRSQLSPLKLGQMNEKVVVFP